MLNTDLFYEYFATQMSYTTTDTPTAVWSDGGLKKMVFPSVRFCWYFLPSKLKEREMFPIIELFYSHPTVNHLH